MQKVTYTNNIQGKSITFGYNPPFLLSSIEGLADIDADVQTQKSPYQDGETHIDTLLQSRSIPITFTIQVNSHSELVNLRNYVSSVFNPKIPGTLRYESGEIIREIDVVCDGSPYFPGGESRGTTYQVGNINLIAPNPYWKSIEQISEPMTAYIGLFQFPLELPTEFGTVGSKQVFYNEGDVPAPVQIKFRGPATNPRVTNLTTGEYIQINRELREGQSLIVNTEFGNKRVEIDGVNVINWIDLNSTFWQLIPGANEIEYTADAGRDNAVVGITWRNYYVGV